MESLSGRDWASFSLEEIFPVIERGKRLKKSDHIPGNTPYISSSSQRNGIDGFIGNTKGTGQAENCLTIANSGSVGFSFYHPYRFIASDSVTILKRDGMSPNCYLFISACLDRVKACYSFQRGMNDLRIRRQRIMLPVDSGGNPDWEFMEAGIKNNTPPNIKTAPVSFNNAVTPYDWQPFNMGDIFYVRGGTDKPAKSFSEGDTPLISSSESNNGITRFVDTETTVEDCLTINRNGSVGAAHYHPYRSVVTNDCRVLTFKDGESKSRTVNLFFVACINAQREKYDWGYKMGTQRILKQRIMLPIDSDGNIDYDFMERFIGDW